MRCVVPLVHEKSYLRPATLPRTSKHQFSFELRITRTPADGVPVLDVVTIHLETAVQFRDDTSNGYGSEFADVVPCGRGLESGRLILLANSSPRINIKAAMDTQSSGLGKRRAVAMSASARIASQKKLADVADNACVFK